MKQNNVAVLELNQHQWGLVAPSLTASATKEIQEDLDITIIY